MGQRASFRRSRARSGRAARTLREADLVQKLIAPCASARVGELRYRRDDRPAAALGGVSLHAGNQLASALQCRGCIQQVRCGLGGRCGRCGRCCCNLGLARVAVGQDAQELAAVGQRVVDQAPPRLRARHSPARQDEKIAGPRRRHVQKAPALRCIPLGVASTHRRAVRSPAPPSRPANPQRQAEVGVQRDALRRLSRHRAALRDDHDRKFQSLRGMHRQEPHCVRVSLLDHVGIGLARVFVGEATKLRDEAARVPAV